jgi:hypothetical protein
MWLEPMADNALTPEDGFRIERLFGSEDSSAPFTRGHRKYVLEYQDGEPAFRLAEIPSKPTLPRDEIGVALDEVMAELFGPDPDGNEIVPQKLAKSISRATQIVRHATRPPVQPTGPRPVVIEVALRRRLPDDTAGALGIYSARYRQQPPATEDRDAFHRNTSNTRNLAETRVM